MGWKIQGSIPCRDKKCVFSPKHPDWLWGLPSLLGGWEGGCGSGRVMKLTTRLHTVLRLRISGAVPYLLP